MMKGGSDRISRLGKVLSNSKRAYLEVALRVAYT